MPAPHQCQSGMLPMNMRAAQHGASLLMPHARVSRATFAMRHASAAVFVTSPRQRLSECRSFARCARARRRPPEPPPPATFSLQPRDSAVNERDEMLRRAQTIDGGAPQDAVDIACARWRKTTIHERCSPCRQMRHSALMQKILRGVSAAPANTLRPQPHGASRPTSGQ